jgi:hypothetical protein
VELLEKLHESRYGGNPRYNRIVIVAHSLGAYIAYDGISHLWGTMNYQAHPDATGAPDGLGELEQRRPRCRPRASARPTTPTSPSFAGRSTGCGAGYVIRATLG